MLGRFGERMEEAFILQTSHADSGSFLAELLGSAIGSGWQASAVGV